MITIKMPEALFNAWVGALRAGTYPRGKGLLLDVDGNYCPLGVLEMVADGKVSDAVLPSFEWLADHEIAFFRQNGDVALNPDFYTLKGYTEGGVSYSVDTLADWNDAGISMNKIIRALEQSVTFNKEEFL